MAQRLSGMPVPGRTHHRHMHYHHVRSPRERHHVAQVEVEVANDPAAQVFDQFCNANTFQGIMGAFQQLCDILELKPSDHHNFFKQLKARLTTWKAQSLWAKLDKKASHRDYKKANCCLNTRVFIIGAGPCGLRAAIEIALMGGKAVIVEKRDRFSRNNVLHLWPFIIHDLKALGAKKFFGKFFAGSIEHISIRALQCILLKVALLVGVEIHPNVAFDGLREPPADQSEPMGWRANITPADHPVSQYEFDVIIGADGKRNTLSGFKRKEFRGKLAIAITANFINRNTNAEARVEEISGVAFIFNQKFFKDLNAKTGIDLENIVYYKDDTHYFVMTAKKSSLLRKRVLKFDYQDTARLLSQDNVNQEALMSYAREAADVSTNYQLPSLDYAHNHYGQPDVAMFDFTSIFSAEHASRVLEKNSHKLIMALVGDSLLEPFWPTGSGCARGFLGCMDTAWMIRSWASGRMTPLEVIAERESIYQLLSQTSPEHLNKNFAQYSIDPNTRYPNLNLQYFKPWQVRHQFEGDDSKYLNEIVQIRQKKSKIYDWIRDSHYLLKWFERHLESYRGIVQVTDLTSSWRNGLALCSLIHKYRPELIDVYKLDPNEVAANNQLAFDIAEKEFGIAPIMRGEDMAVCEVPDKLTMVSYLTQFYDYFRKESIRPAKIARTPETLGIKDRTRHPKSPSQRMSMMSRINSRMRQRREDEKENGEEAYDTHKRHTTFNYGLARKRMRANHEQATEPGVVLQRYSKFEGLEPEDEERLKHAPEDKEKMALDPGVRGQNKVSILAKGLAEKFKGERSPPKERKQPVVKQMPKPLVMGQKLGSGDMCYFCQKRVYLVERHSAEGVFFHRGCFRCSYCNTNLRIGQYAFQRSEDGTAKFYCYQHKGKQRRMRRHRRRRTLEEKEAQLAAAAAGQDSTESESTESEPEIETSDGPPLSPGLVPPSLDIGGGAHNKTPERIEYYTESEMEESEMDQTQHNLSASLLDLQGEESDSDESSDEDIDWSDEQLSDGETSWAEIAKSYSKQITRSIKKKTRAIKREAGDDDDDDGSETPCGSTASESETEKESEGEETDDEELVKKKFSQSVSSPRYSAAQLRAALKQPPPEKKPSPREEAVGRNRFAFFSAPTEPVRIDAWSFLGLKSPETKPEVITEVKAEGEVKRKAHEEEESDSDLTSSEGEGDLTITEGSESEDDQVGIVQSVKHPIPTIEIEEVDVGDTTEYTTEDEEIDFEGQNVEEERNSNAEEESKEDEYHVDVEKELALMQQEVDKMRRSLEGQMDDVVEKHDIEVNVDEKMAYMLDEARTETERKEEDVTVVEENTSMLAQEEDFSDFLSDYEEASRKHGAMRDRLKFAEGLEEAPKASAEKMSSTSGSSPESQQTIAQISQTVPSVRPTLTTQEVVKLKSSPEEPVASQRAPQNVVSPEEPPCGLASPSSSSTSSSPSQPSQKSMGRSSPAKPAEEQATHYGYAYADLKHVKRTEREAFPVMNPMAAEMADIAIARVAPSLAPNVKTTMKPVIKPLPQSPTKQPPVYSLPAKKSTKSTPTSASSTDIDSSDITSWGGVKSPTHSSGTTRSSEYTSSSDIDSSSRDLTDSSPTKSPFDGDFPMEKTTFTSSSAEKSPDHAPFEGDLPLRSPVTESVPTLPSPLKPTPAACPVTPKLSLHKVTPTVVNFEPLEEKMTWTKEEKIDSPVMKSPPVTTPEYETVSPPKTPEVRSPPMMAQPIKYSDVKPHDVWPAIVKSAPLTVLRTVESVGPGSHSPPNETSPPEVTPTVSPPEVTPTESPPGETTPTMSPPSRTPNQQLSPSMEPPVAVTNTTDISHFVNDSESGISRPRDIPFTMSVPSDASQTQEPPERELPLTVDSPMTVSPVRESSPVIAPEQPMLEELPDSEVEINTESSGEIDQMEAEPSDIPHTEPVSSKLKYKDDLRLQITKLVSQQIESQSVCEPSQTISPVISQTVTPLHSERASPMESVDVMMSVEPSTMKSPEVTSPTKLRSVKSPSPIEPAVQVPLSPIATEPVVQEPPSPVATEPAVQVPLSPIATEPVVQEPLSPIATEPAVQLSLSPIATEPAVQEPLSPIATEPAVQLSLSPIATEPAVQVPIATEPSIEASDVPSSMKSPIKSIKSPEMASTPTQRLDQLCLKEEVPELPLLKTPEKSLQIVKIDPIMASPNWSTPSTTGGTPMLTSSKQEQAIKRIDELLNKLKGPHKMEIIMPKKRKVELKAKLVDSKHSGREPSVEKVEQKMEAAEAKMTEVESKMEELVAKMEVVEPKTEYIRPVKIKTQGRKEDEAESRMETEVEIVEKVKEKDEAMEVVEDEIQEEITERADAAMPSEEEKLDEEMEEEAMNESKLVEVTIPGSEENVEKSFTVDEQFVTSRGRKKRKGHKGDTTVDQGSLSDSSFTISTPSGSVKSLSSISEMESMPNSLRASLEESASIDHLISSFPDDSISIDNLLEPNADDEDLEELSSIPKTPGLEKTLTDQTDSRQNSILQSSTDRTLEPSYESSFKDARSANTTTATDESHYFTPNVSTLDTSRDVSVTFDSSKDLHTKSSDTHSTGSDQKSLSSLTSDTTSPIYSPNRGLNLNDAKRKFFLEAAQPLRIDPKSMFRELRSPEGKKDVIAQASAAKRAGKENKVPESETGSRKELKHSNSVDQTSESPKRIAVSLDLKRDWQSLDSGVPSSPTAGVPHSDSVNGETDTFYTPATSVKQKPPPQQPPSKHDVRKRILPSTPAGPSKVDPSKRVLTKEDIRMLKEVEREKSRQVARQRARLLSDEDLGIHNGKGDSVRNGVSEALSHKDIEEAQKGPPKKGGSDASSRSDGSHRTISEGSNRGSGDSMPRAGLSDSHSDRSESSPSTSRKDAKNEKNVQLSPSRTRKNKDKKAKPKSKSNDEGKGSEKKEKKRSLLALFLPSKSAEKKEKTKTPKSPKEKKTPEKNIISKLRPKAKTPKSEKEVKLQETAEKRTSGNDEFSPFFEDMYGQDGSKPKNLKDRLEEVAPNLPKSQPKLAPKATMDEFESESDMGDADRISIKSFQSVQSQIFEAMTEDERERYIKKQQKVHAKRIREQELKRLRTAQEIQRQLEEVEIKQRDIERRGIAIERALRGEGADGSRNEPELMQEWFNVVHEKNMLVRYESELMVHARELELEDRHSRLDQQLRDLMTIEEPNKTVDEKEEEQRILQELLEVVEQRDALVALLEEDRLRTKEDTAKVAEASTVECSGDELQ